MHTMLALIWFVSSSWCAMVSPLQLGNVKINAAIAPIDVLVEILQFSLHDG